MKPYAESCDQNREPILSVIEPLLRDARTVLEVGSGTGQHAVYFAKELPHLLWQTSDQVQYHSGIQSWLNEAGLSNTLPPIALNVSEDSWPTAQFDVLYCSNVMHIMSWDNVVDLFSSGSQCIKEGGLMVSYGPFNYDGKFTSDSNALFDQSLKMRDPKSGIRDTGDLQTLAKKSHLSLLEDFAMPANNRVLVWKKERLPER